MGHKLRLNGVVEESVTDGPGMRFVVFMQGCPHNCPGCHNPETHDVDGGYLTNTDAVMTQFSENPLLSGMTLSGGEPFLQPEAARVLAESVKRSGKHLMVYTGYLCQELVRQSRRDANIRRVLELTDTLIDGRYDQKFRSLTLDFKGSSNQRTLMREDILRCLREMEMKLTGAC